MVGVLVFLWVWGFCVCMCLVFLTSRLLQPVFACPNTVSYFRVNYRKSSYTGLLNLRVKSFMLSKNL